MKTIVAAIFGLILLLTLIPLSVFLVYGGEYTQVPSYIGTGPTVERAIKKEIEAAEPFVVPVMRYATQTLEEVDLEYYIKGVVASEMSPGFELEALKAQAIAARTFVVYSLQGRDHIVDTVMDQVFRDEDQLRERWGDNFDQHWNRIAEAVRATEGLIMTHEGEPIDALFFSMSNGRTENSEDVFAAKRPYLRSVESPWDLEAPRFEVETEFTLANFRQLLGDNTLTASDVAILSRSQGGNALEVQVGNRTMTGRQFREALSLRSSDFSLQGDNNIVVITTRGNGHGVGMSQYGANAMAAAGKSFGEILNFYYQDIKIEQK